jgi:hypothetical protein
MSYTSSLKKHIQRDDLGGAIAPWPLGPDTRVGRWNHSKNLQITKVCIYIYIYIYFFFF